MPLPQLIESAHSAVRDGKNDVIVRAGTRRTASTMRRPPRRQNEITESLSGRTGILIWTRPHNVREIAPVINGRSLRFGVASPPVAAWGQHRASA